MTKALRVLKFVLMYVCARYEEAPSDRMCQWWSSLTPDQRTDLCQQLATLAAILAIIVAMIGVIIGAASLVVTNMK